MDTGMLGCGSSLWGYNPCGVVWRALGSPQVSPGVWDVQSCLRQGCTLWCHLTCTGLLLFEFRVSMGLKSPPCPTSELCWWKNQPGPQTIPSQGCTRAAPAPLG